MGSLSQAKTLGGLGSILVIMSLVPRLGLILGFVGFILELIAIKYISEFLADNSIFNNMIVSVLASIAGLILALIFIIAVVFSFIGLSGIQWVPNVGPSMPSDVKTSNAVGLLFGILAGLAVVWVCFVISAIFRRRSYNAIGTKLGVRLFETVALLYLIGAVTTVILVGFLILLLAEVLQIVAFFSIPELPPPPDQVTATQIV